MAERVSSIGVRHTLQLRGGPRDCRMFMTAHTPPSKFDHHKIDLVDALRGRGTPDAHLASLSASFNRMVAFHSREEKGEEAILGRIAVGKTLANWGFGYGTISAAFAQNIPVSKRSGIAPEIENIANRHNSLEAVSSSANDISKSGIINSVRMLLLHERSREVWALKAANDYAFLASGSKENAQKKAGQAYFVISEILKMFDLEEASLDLSDIALLRFDSVAFQRAESEVAKAAGSERALAMQTIADACELVAVELENAGLKFEIQYGIKRASSADRKLRKPGESLTDGARFRVIIDGHPSRCKKAYSTIVSEMAHNGFVEDVRETKNYINGLVLGNTRNPRIDIGPKPNGYESVHVLFRKPRTQEAISVQIRTKTMHEVAEKGTAAHSSFKTAELLGPTLNRVDTQARQIAELRWIYATNAEGTAYQLKPYPKENTVRILDLAFAVSPETGLLCPDFVEVERYDEQSERIVISRVSIFDPLQNGDKVIFPGSPRRSATSITPPAGRDKKVGTLAAQVIISQAQKGEFDPTAQASRSSQLKEMGLTLLSNKLVTLEATLKARLARILRLEGEDPNTPNIVLYSLDRVARLLGVQNEDGLHLAIGLLKNRDQIIEDAVNILNNSPLAVAYKIEGEHADVWLLSKDVPGIFHDILSSIKDAGGSPLRIEANQVAGGLTLVKTRINLPGAEDLEAKLASDLFPRLRALYNGKTVSQDEVKTRSRKVKLTFTPRRMDMDLLLKVLSQIFEARLNVTYFAAKPLYSGGEKTIKIKGFACELVFEMPERSDEAMTEKLIRRIQAAVSLRSPVRIRSGPIS